jgi:predicted transcriptional regulator
MGRPLRVVRVNYNIDDELHRRAKTLASWKGQTFKAWLERAIAEVVERQEDERTEDERQRRLR